MSGPYPYGHNPYGAMYACEVCGARFRTVERLRAHEDDDGDLCAERAAMQPPLFGDEVTR